MARKNVWQPDQSVCIPVRGTMRRRMTPLTNRLYRRNSRSEIPRGRPTRKSKHVFHEKLGLRRRPGEKVGKKTWRERDRSNRGPCPALMALKADEAPKRVPGRKTKSLVMTGKRSTRLAGTGGPWKGRKTFALGKS